MLEIPNTIPNLLGKTFTALTVVDYVGKSTTNGWHYWLCLCVCGKTPKIGSFRLVHNQTKSCGCLNRYGKLRHGECSLNSETAEYRAFGAARSRCTNPNHVSYKNYGAKGVEFRFTSFEEFLNEVGRKPTPQHSIDRINPCGHYEPGNVRWATRSEQRRNHRPKG